MKIVRRFVLVVVAAVTFAAMSVSAGTCKDPGKNLTKQEFHNVRTACEQMAAAVAGWKDPAEGARRLRAIQADDFRFMLPSSDPWRFRMGTREDYIHLVTVIQHEAFASGTLNIYATTAQGNRVATEMESTLTERNGVAVHRKYHQLYEFDGQGKIRRYKLYMDTAAFVREEKARSERVVNEFLAGLTASPTANLADVLTDSVSWGTMDRAAVLKTLASLPQAFRDLKVTPKADGFTVQGNRVAVQATSEGTRIDGTPYRNNYHFLFVLKDGKIDQIHGFAVGPET